MILSLILFVGWTFAGRKLLQKLSIHLPSLVELSAGLLLGNLFIVYAIFLFGFFFPHSSIVFVLTAISGLWCILFFPRQIKVDKFWAPVFIFPALFFSILYSLIWQTSQGSITLRMRGVWGDWGHHIGLPLYYKSINRTVLENPFVSGQKFTYSFLNAYIPEAMLQLRSPLRESIIFPGILWSVSLSLLIVFFGKEIGLKKLSWLSPILFFLSGNLGFIYFFKDHLAFPLLREYGHFWESNFHFGNILDFFFVSQRSFLFGFGFGLIILLSVLKSERKSSYLFAGILFGLLPLVHMHSFISLGLVLAVYTLIKFKNWRSWLWFWFPAATLSLPVLNWLAISIAGKFLSVKLGWMAGSENWIWFWIKNTPIIITGILGTWFIPAWAPFIIANLIQFQPNLADNNKLFVWWYLLVGVYPTLLFLERVNKKIISLILVFVITFSGILQLVWVFQNKWEFANPEELKLAEFAKNSCPQGRWLTHDRHNHPVFTFAGRPLVMGYRGWLWTWGVNYTQVETDVRLMYQFPDQNRYLFQKHQVSYAVIGPAEIQEYHPDITKWQEIFPLVYNSEKYLVFAVSPCQ